MVGNISGAITSMVALLLVAVIGFAATKLGALSGSSRGAFSSLLLNVTLPCAILASAGYIDTSGGASQVAWTFGFAAVYFFVMLAAGYLCVLILRPPRSQRHLYVFMSLLTNTGFVGIAVVTAVYGGAAAFVGSVFVAMHNLFFYSLGVCLLMHGGAKLDGEGAVQRKLSIDWKAIVNAPLVASVLAIAVFAFNLQIPDAVGQTLDMVGGITAPLAMMVVGQIVAESDLRGLLSDWRVLAFTLLRFLAIPALVFVVARLASPDPLALGVFVVMLAVPVGSMASMIAAAYGQDANLPAKGTIVSTTASFLIIPALIAFMGI